jgi:hypothetical protein
MVTREQYLEALDVVETYHQQLRQKSIERNLNWDDLKRGDTIVFDRISHTAKNITQGKEYAVIDVEHNWKYDSWAKFRFHDDNNKIKIQKKHTGGYIGRIV